MPDQWIERLKAAYDAGYYKTEASEERQISLPWQDKRCKPSLMKWLLAALSVRLWAQWNRKPVWCLQCGRVFSTMTQGVQRMHGMWCWECYRVYMLRAQPIMAAYGRRD